MTPLTQAEIEAARNIGELLAGQPQRTVARAYSAAMNRMLAQLLIAGWALERAGNRAVQFGDAVLAELEQAKAKKALH